MIDGHYGRNGEELVRNFLISKIDSVCLYGQFWTGSKKGNIGLFEVDCFWPELGLLVEIKTIGGTSKGRYNKNAVVFSGRKAAENQIENITSSLLHFGFDVVSKVTVLVCEDRTDFCSLQKLTEPGARILRVQLSELNSWF